MIQNFLINLLLIWGIWKLFQPGMILGKLGNWLSFKNVNNSNGSVSDRRLNELITKPLFDCPPCMSSIWGTIGFIIFGYDLIYWPIWVICLTGASAIISKVR